MSAADRASAMVGLAPPVAMPDFAQQLDDLATKCMKLERALVVAYLLGECDRWATDSQEWRMLIHQAKKIASGEHLFDAAKEAANG